jgi:hypothetical protein
MADPFIARDGQVMLVAEDEAPVAIAGGISTEGFQIVSAFCDGYLWAGYLRDAKGIWWSHARSGKALFVTGDADAFRVLDDNYGLDSSTVYLENRAIPGSDPASFALVENGTYFACDRHRLYVKDGSHFFHFDGIDTDSLVANGPYVSDRDHLFHHDGALSFANDAKETATVQHSLHGEHDMLLKDWFVSHHCDIVGWWHPDYKFKLDEAEPIAGNWFRTRDAVFFLEFDKSMRGTTQVFYLVRGAAPDGFEPLDDVHGRDAGGVYCRWRRVDGADPESFAALGGLFGRDRSAVYFNGYSVKDADPGSFAMFPTLRAYAKDGRRVYARQFARTSQPFGHPDDILSPLDKADPATFEPFGERGAWAADAGGVYLHGERKKKLDAGSFRFLCETGTNSWAGDRSGLYRSNGAMTVAGIDGAAFRMLNGFWGSDGNVVFSFVTGAIQKSIEAKTFEITDDEGGARDATSVYRIEDGSVRKRKR